MGKRQTPPLCNLHQVAPWGLPSDSSRPSSSTLQLLLLTLAFQPLHSFAALCSTHSSNSNSFPAVRAPNWPQYFQCGRRLAQAVCAIPRGAQDQAAIHPAPRSPMQWVAPSPRQGIGSRWALCSQPKPFYDSFYESNFPGSPGSRNV